LSDEDELENDAAIGPSIDDILLVDTLMGWDGEACRCPECVCPRFVDGSNVVLCASCLAGDHWRADA
jgi:hypothetical protein